MRQVDLLSHGGELRLRVRQLLVHPRSTLKAATLGTSLSGDGHRRFALVVECHRIPYPLTGRVERQGGGGAAVRETQPVTEKDIEKGIIRLPHEAKEGLPKERSVVPIVLNGTRLDVPFDPRLGPDRERSGVLHIGKAAASTLQPGERLSARLVSGELHLG